MPRDASRVPMRKGMVRAPNPKKTPSTFMAGPRFSASWMSLVRAFVPPLSPPPPKEIRFVPGVFGIDLDLHAVPPGVSRIDPYLGRPR
jgi:hypothetical protein